MKNGPHDDHLLRREGVVDKEKGVEDATEFMDFVYVCHENSRQADVSPRQE